MKQGYLIIENMQVDYLNFAANWFTTGIPMTAIAGYAHALERSLKAQGLNVGFSGFAPIFHDHEVRSGGIRMTKSLQGDGSLNAPPSLGERRTFGRLTLSLMLVLDAPNAEPQQPGTFSRTRAFSLTDDDIAKIHAFASSQRLNGGVCMIEKVRFASTNDTAAFKEAIKSIPAGFLITDRRDLVAHYRDTLSVDTLDAQLHALALHPQCDDEGEWLGLDEAPRRNASEPVLRRRAQKGWIVPLATGFVSRETPKADRIQDYDHVYAEPVCTLAECISSKRLINKLLSKETAFDTAFDKDFPFWAYDVQPDAGIYTINQINIEKTN